MAQNEEQQVKVKISVSSIKADLKAGIDRKGIGKKYGLSPTDVKRLFEDPALKGLKVRKAPAFELEHDEEEVATAPKKPAPVKKTAAPKATVKEEEKIAEVEEEEVATKNEEEEEEEQEVEVKSSPKASAKKAEPLKEVETDDDDVELADEVKPTTKKGLW